LLLLLLSLLFVVVVVVVFLSGLDETEEITFTKTHLFVPPTVLLRNSCLILLVGRTSEDMEENFEVEQDSSKWCE